MSEFTDTLRLVADFIDGGHKSLPFIKSDIRNRIIAYVNDIKANAALIEQSEKIDQTDLQNLDGTKFLKDRKDGSRTNQARRGPGREEPWWYSSSKRTIRY